MLSLDDAERLSRFEAGELTGEELRAFEAELLTRRELRDGLERLQQMQKLTETTELEDAAMSRRALSRLRLVGAPKPTHRRWAALAVAAAAVLAAASGAWFVSGPSNRPVDAVVAEQRQQAAADQLSDVEVFPQTVSTSIGSHQVRLERGSLVAPAGTTVRCAGGSVTLDALSLVSTEPEAAIAHVQSAQPAVEGADMPMFELIKAAAAKNQWKTSGALWVLSLALVAGAVQPTLAAPPTTNNLALLERATPQLVACFADAAPANPKLFGRNLLTMHLDPRNNQPVGVDITGPDAQVHAYTDCVKRVVAGLPFVADGKPIAWGLFVERDGAVGYRAGALRPGERPEDWEQVEMPELDGSPVFGNPNAAVTMVVFDNLDCVYCTRNHLTIVRLREAYGDRVRFVSKNFPKPTQPLSREAAYALYAANEQGQFLPYVDALYAMDKSTEANLVGVASKTGLDVERFNRVRHSEAAQAQIARDLKAAEAAKLVAVPASIIDGKPITGALPYERFAQMIERALQNHR